MQIKRRKAKARSRNADHSPAVHPRRKQKEPFSSRRRACHGAPRRPASHGRRIAPQSGTNLMTGGLYHPEPSWSTRLWISIVPIGAGVAGSVLLLDAILPRFWASAPPSWQVPLGTAVYAAIQSAVLPALRRLEERRRLWRSVRQCLPGIVASVKDRPELPTNWSELSELLQRLHGLERDENRRHMLSEALQEVHAVAASKQYAAMEKTARLLACEALLSPTVQP